MKDKNTRTTGTSRRTTRRRTTRRRRTKEEGNKMHWTFIQLLELSVQLLWYLCEINRI